MACVVFGMFGTATAICMLGELSSRTIYDRKKNAKTNGYDASGVTKMKMVIIGGIFVVVMGLVAFGTLMVIGGDPAPVAETEASHDSGEAKKKEKKDHKPESVSKNKKSHSTDKKETEDESLLGAMMENLAVLDYEPGPDELTTQDGSMSINDSIKGANWLESAKVDLVKREKTLDLKQRELDKLDRKVSQILLKIEQAESSRVNQLAKLYDGMEPTAIAKLMLNLENEIVVEILPRMKSKNAAIVLSLLPPKRAANLSKQMITLADN